MKYIVTNIRLEASMFRSLKLRALQRGVPASVLIREAIEKHLASTELTPEEYERAKADLLRLGGLGRSKGPGTGSTDIDEVLYGPRRPRKPK
jgi:predicted DNA-binding protein